MHHPLIPHTASLKKNRLSVNMFHTASYFSSFLLRLIVLGGRYRPKPGRYAPGSDRSAFSYSVRTFRHGFQRLETPLRLWQTASRGFALSLELVRELLEFFWPGFVLGRVLELEHIG